MEQFGDRLKTHYSPVHANTREEPKQGKEGVLHMRGCVPLPRCLPNVALAPPRGKDDSHATIEIDENEQNMRGYKMTDK